MGSIPAGGVEMYSCKDGLCFKDKKGLYKTFEECVAICATRTQPKPPSTTGPVKGSADSTSDKSTNSSYVDSGGGLCPTGQYWCSSSSKCISVSQPCK